MAEDSGNTDTDTWARWGAWGRWAYVGWVWVGLGGMAWGEVICDGCGWARAGWRGVR